MFDVAISQILTVRKRLNLSLPERTIARLEAVKLATAAKSITDVIINAMLTMEALVEFIQGGYKFYVKKDGEDHYQRVNFLFDVVPENPVKPD